MEKLLLTILLTLSFGVLADESKTINLITDRSDVHLLDLVNKFQQGTEVTVNVTFVKDGIVEKAKNYDYDILITKDSSELVAASDSLKEMHDYVLNDVPPEFKDNKDKKWFLMSYRIRSFHIKNGVKDIPESYEDLAKPQYKDRICIRNVTHNYNLELFGTMISDMGEEKFVEWYKGFKNNIRGDSAANDRSQVKAVYEGKCDIAVANSYYRGLMLQDPEQKSWAEATTLYIPNQKSTGAIALYSGVGMLTNNMYNDMFAKFLIRDDIQQSISKNNFEYVLNSNNVSDVVKTFGKEQDLKYETIKLHQNIQNELFELRKKAYLIIKEN